MLDVRENTQNRSQFHTSYASQRRCRSSRSETIKVKTAQEFLRETCGLCTGNRIDVKCDTSRFGSGVCMLAPRNSRNTENCPSAAPTLECSLHSVEEGVPDVLDAPRKRLLDFGMCALEGSVLLHCQSCTESGTLCL